LLASPSGSHWHGHKIQSIPLAGNETRFRSDRNALTRSRLAIISMFMEMKNRAMESDSAIAALGALAQQHRLALFRLLVQAGEAGLAAGAIASRLGIPNSSLSFHLAQLARAGLVRQERRHRSILYRADYGAMTALLSYLTENCCGGAIDCLPDIACAAAPDPVTAAMRG
jgi:DNA-binding transcriptional ArsR family regulator